MTRPAQESTRLVVLAHDSRRDGDCEVHELSLRVPTDLRWLRGHFDEYPVLPAVVQLWEVQSHLRAIWPDLVVPRRVSRAKFRRPICPEDLLVLRLRRAVDRSQASFEYRRGDEVCSAGVMVFRPPEGDAGE